MARKKVSTETKVESIRHKDKRTNIPTDELRDFIADDEHAPKTMLYPRDPSLDPQLVWRGKDEQDRQDLAVPVVPIYIQEKIHPQAIIDDLMGQRKSKPGEQQLNLFNDFNGIDDFDKKIDFYHHAHHWSNRMILGDSLLVMTSLAEKEGLKGKVQTIYFDPPYGIKFGSNWQVSTRKRDVKDGKIEDTTRQPEQIRAFRDTWELGIHSYLTYLRERLVVAHELLTETGSIFVQIGDENMHLVRCILDEVFGSENFCSVITIKKTGGQSSSLLPRVSDYLLWYAISVKSVKYNQLYHQKELGIGEGSGARYDQVEDLDGKRRPIRRDELENPGLLPTGSRAFQLTSLKSSGYRADTTVNYHHNQRVYNPGNDSHWKTTVSGLRNLATSNRVAVRSQTIAYVRYLDDFPAYQIGNVWPDVAGATDQVYVVQTSPSVIERCILMTTDPGDLVFDPSCGSGTTAFVSEQWGRRWITIDTSRVALALARTRILAAKYPYYLLSDSCDGIKKEAEITGQSAPPYGPQNDVRKGFVYKRVPHVTLKSIANNPDIKEGMTRVQIDQAIARHAETETLYDKPYEDPKCIRVSGPFTVESLSPHRVLATDEESPRTELAGAKDATTDFATMVLDNLRKAGVQNTVKNERLKFDTLDPFAGTWLNATGTSTGADGKAIRVAVSIGPEHGTVGPQQVKEAAKEAVLGIGFDILIVCGFAFDPHVAEEAKRYGKLTVLPARMNPDLLIGTGNESLLKNTGAGNLFMVFGEPDVEVTFVHSDGPIDGMNGEFVQVEIKGVDVYDPTTGQIRNASTDDIACWFIDTDYNGESFFVRQAYFTGADEPYEKLKRALKAEIDEEAWSSLYSTKSWLFPKPVSKKIAVKVINHYGDEVLKVIAV